MIRNRQSDSQWPQNIANQLAKVRPKWFVITPKVIRIWRCEFAYFQPCKYVHITYLKQSNTLFSSTYITTPQVIKIEINYTVHYSTYILTSYSMLCSWCAMGPICSLNNLEKRDSGIFRRFLPQSAYFRLVPHFSCILWLAVFFCYIFRFFYF